MGEEELINQQDTSQEDSLNEILGKSPKLIGKIRSQIDKVDDIEIRPDGTVVHKILRTFHKPKKNKSSKKSSLSLKDQNRGRYREWPSIDKFKAWRKKHFK